MANQETYCKIHQRKKKMLPAQYWCPDCNKDYRNKRNKKELNIAKEISSLMYSDQKDVTSEADPAKRDEKETPIIFD